MLPKRLIPLLILLLSAALNTLSLARYERFHPDEAFYMTFARNAAVNGDWWLTGSLDKPPLTIYINALALKLLAVDTDANGVFQLDVYKGEFAVRATGVLIGVLLVAVIKALAKALNQENCTAWVAGLLTALSPFTLAFSPTAFTDMPMLLFGMLAWYAALKHKPGWSGFWLVLAFACKPQAIFLLPIILAFQRVSVSANSAPGKASIHFCEWRNKLIILFLAIFMGGVILFAWDALHPGDSVFVLGAVNVSSNTMFAPEMWLSRLALWLQYGQYLMGNAVTTGIFLMLAAWSFVRRQGTSCPSRWQTGFLWLWLMGFSGFHIVSSLNLHDRYLLLAMPIFVLLAARSFSTTEIQRTRRFHREKSRTLSGFLCLCILALNLFSVPPIGSDRGDYRGIDELANYLNAKPVATVIYDRWLTWELGYYMGQWTDKRRVYYPTPAALAEGARALPENGRRYWPAPENVDIIPWLAALDDAGFSAEFEIQIEGFRVYGLTPLF